MSLLTALSPRRELVFPLLVFAFPTLYFVYRDAQFCASSGGCLEHLGYAVAGIGVSYLLAVGVLALADGLLGAESGYARLALRPSDGTLVVTGALVGGIAVYGVLSLVGAVPPWLDSVLAPIGLVVGFPFAAAVAGMTLLGSAVGREPSMVVQFGVVAVSLALTGAWVFLLATGTAGLLGGTVSDGVGSG